jgi:NitT/TauT family transport system permease protein
MLEEKALVGAPERSSPARVEKRPRRLTLGMRQRLIGTVAVVLFMLAWEGFVRYGLVNPMFTSSPTRIVSMFIKMVQEGAMAKDLRVSGVEFAAGYLMAVGVGIPVGVAMGWYRDVEAALQPFVAALYSTPRIALVPLFIIWLGIGIWSKIALVFLVTVFQILISTEAGVHAADESLIRTARSFGANDRQIFTSVVLPGAVPFLIAGLRLGLGQAIIGIVVGELYAATAGIGYEIAVAGETFQIDRVFVGIVILATAGIVMMWALRQVERRFESWRPQRQHA